MKPTNSMNKWPPTPKSIKHNTCIAKQTFLCLCFYMFTCWLFVFTTSLRDVASEFDLNVQELWLAACSVSACMFRFSWGRQRRGRTQQTNTLTDIKNPHTRWSHRVDRHLENTPMQTNEHVQIGTDIWIPSWPHQLKKQIEHGSNKINA